jgi:hypothetical protein
MKEAFMMMDVSVKLEKGVIMVFFPAQRADFMCYSRSFGVQAEP